MIKNIKFPAIIFDRDENIHFARNEDDIVICNNDYWKEGNYKNLEIIDIEGNLYKVVDAYKIKNKGVFWGYNLFLNKKIIVELDLEKHISKIDEQVFKDRVGDSLLLNEEFWGASDDFDEKINFVKETNSVGEIIEKLCNLYYGENYEDRI